MRPPNHDAQDSQAFQDKLFAKKDKLGTLNSKISRGRRDSEGSNFSANTKAAWDMVSEDSGSEDSVSGLASESPNGASITRASLKTVDTTVKKHADKMFMLKNLRDRRRTTNIRNRAASGLFKPKVLRSPPTPLRAERQKLQVTKLANARKRAQSNRDLDELVTSISSKNLPRVPKKEPPASAPEIINDESENAESDGSEHYDRRNEFAAKATRMRRSIRLKTLPNELGTNTRAKKKQNERNINLLINKKSELKAQHDGIAARLSRKELFDANFIGLGRKSFFPLDQLIAHFFDSRRISDIGGPQISLYFRFYICKEICRTVNEQHMRTPAHPHGAISAESVLLDRNLDVELQKPKVIKAVNNAIVLKRLQRDILYLGVVLLETMTLSRVSHNFCPSVLTCQETEVTHGKQWNKRNPSKKSFDKFPPGFSAHLTIRQKADLPQTVLKELSNAITSSAKKLTFEAEQIDTFTETLVEKLNRCLDLNPGNRPMAIELEQMFDGFKNTLFPDIVHEDDLLKMLKLIIQHKRLFGGVKKSPPIMDRTLNRSNRKLLHNMSEKRNLRLAPSSPSKSKASTNTSMAEISLDDDKLNMRDDESYMDKSMEKKLVEAPAAVKAKPKKKKNKLLAFLTSGTTKSTSFEEETTKSQKPLSIADFSTVGDNTDSYQEEAFRARGDSLDGEKHDLIKKNVRASTAIRAEDLKLFRTNFNEYNAVKNKAKETKHKFSPSHVAAHFDVQKTLHPDLAKAILKKAKSIFKDEPNVLRLEANISIIGDIHGQYFDLRNIIDTLGKPGEKNHNQKYLFLGDYVDRGDFSCEVFFYLLSLKIRYPEHVSLLRGNHESRVTTRSFGFKEECESKYGAQIFRKACALFDALPIAATVKTPKGTFFCLHGGISPNVTELYQFREFDRFMEPSLEGGFLCDVLWADPVTYEDAEQDANEEYEDEDEEDEDIKAKRKEFMDSQLQGEYFTNSLRRCSYRFGMLALQKFLQDNELLGIIRAHQVQMEGYSYHFQDLAFADPTMRGEATSKDQVCPPIITVFSAPNYCGKYGNQGAYLNIYKTPPEYADDEEDARNNDHTAFDLIEPVQFDAVDSPPAVELGNNVQESKQLNLEKFCPYMPNDLESLIEMALNLGKLNQIKLQDTRQSSVASFRAKGKGMLTALTKNRPRNRAPPKVPRKLSRSTTKRLTRKKTMLRYSAARPAKETVQPTSWKNFQERMNDYKTNAQGKYHLAKRSDRLNEASPLWMEKKIDKAKTMNTSALKSVKTLINNSSALDMSSFMESEVTLANSKEVDDDALLFSLDNKHRWENIVHNKEMQFAPNELLALQTYYVIIDIDEKGKIGVDDLVRWTKDQGGFVIEEHAEMALGIMDFDGDGAIGFEDFLYFAGAAKRIWMAEQLDLLNEN